MHEAEREDGKGVGKLPLCRYGCNEMEIKGIETVKETKELGESAETVEDGGEKIDPFEA